MWLTKFKTALILENFEAISVLLNEMPQFSTQQEMEEAFYLLAQTKVLVENNKTQTAQTIHQLKNSINFLKSTQVETPSSLNLKL